MISRLLASFALLATISVAQPDSARWEARAPLPMGVHRTAGCAGGESFYVMGGYRTPATLDSLFRLDVYHNTWTALRNMPFPTSNHCAVFFPPENRIYTFGGTQTISYDYVQVYDVRTDSWTVRYMPYPDYGMAAAVVAESIYVVFGYELPRRFYRYHPATDMWAQRALLPDTAYQGAMCAVDGKVYYAGGWDSLRVFRQYEPQTNTWSDLPDLPQGRQGLSLLPVGRRIYLVGGGQRWNTQADCRDVYCFDVDSGYWRYDSRMPGNHIAGAFGTGVALTLNWLYACGGYNGTSLADVAWLPSVGLSEGPGRRTAGARLVCRPNPFTAQLAVTTPDRGPLDIIDVCGRTVARLVPESGKVTWNGADFAGRVVPAGVYVVRSGSGTALVRRAGP